MKKEQLIMFNICSNAFNLCLHYQHVDLYVFIACMSKYFNINFINLTVLVCNNLSIFHSKYS